MFQRHFVPYCMQPPSLSLCSCLSPWSLFSPNRYRVSLKKFPQEKHCDILSLCDLPLFPRGQRGSAIIVSLSTDGCTGAITKKMPPIWFKFALFPCLLTPYEYGHMVITSGKPIVLNRLLLWRGCVFRPLQVVLHLGISLT